MPRVTIHVPNDLHEKLTKMAEAMMIPYRQPLQKWLK